SLSTSPARSQAARPRVAQSASATPGARRRSADMQHQEGVLESGDDDAVALLVEADLPRPRDPLQEPLELRRGTSLQDLAGEMIAHEERTVARLGDAAQTLVREALGALALASVAQPVELPAVEADDPG